MWLVGWLDSSFCGVLVFCFLLLFLILFFADWLGGCWAGLCVWFARIVWVLVGLGLCRFGTV